MKWHLEQPHNEIQNLEIQGTNKFHTEHNKILSQNTVRETALTDEIN